MEKTLICDCGGEINPLAKLYSAAKDIVPAKCSDCLDILSRYKWRQEAQKESEASAIRIRSIPEGRKFKKVRNPKVLADKKEAFINRPKRKRRTRAEMEAVDHDLDPTPQPMRVEDEFCSIPDHLPILPELDPTVSKYQYLPDTIIMHNLKDDPDLLPIPEKKPEAKPKPDPDPNCPNCQIARSMGKVEYCGACMAL